MKHKFKRFAAIAVIVLLVGEAIAALICAIIGTDASLRLMSALLYCMVIIPIMAYAWMLVTRAFKKDNPEEHNDSDNAE